MSKVFWKGNTLLAPVPAVLVTCKDADTTNVLTIGWTGIVCSKPPMTYISVRPERFSYNIIKNSGEFVINLTTPEMCRKVDFCGVKSGRDTDKLKVCGFHCVPAKSVNVPVIDECPVSLECKVTDTKELGSHTMFLAEIIGVDADEKYIDSSGKLDLRKSDLIAYAHGEYFSLGRKLGSFGFSVKKRKS